MNNLFSYVMFSAGIGIWLRIYWRGRTSKISSFEKFEHNLPAAFLVYMGVGMFGFNFPLVGHGDNVPIGTTPELLWISLISAPFCSIAFALYLRRVRRNSELLFTVMTCFVFFLFNCAYIALFNGLADFRPAQKHVTKITNKKFYTGKANSYVLFLRDWNNSQSQVRFKTDSVFYRQSAIGDAIELDIKPGALGMEWIQAARRATF